MARPHRQVLGQPSSRSAPRAARSRSLAAAARHRPAPRGLVGGATDRNQRRCVFRRRRAYDDRARQLAVRAFHRRRQHDETPDRRAVPAPRSPARARRRSARRRGRSRRRQRPGSGHRRAPSANIGGMLAPLISSSEPPALSDREARVSPAAASCAGPAMVLDLVGTLDQPKASTQPLASDHATFGSAVGRRRSAPPAKAGPLEPEPRGGQPRSASARPGAPATRRPERPPVSEPSSHST